MGWQMYRSFWRSLWYWIETEPKWLWQRSTRGYDSREVWSIYPKFFERYAEIIQRMRPVSGYPTDLTGYPTDLTPEEWDVILWKIVDGFRAGAELDNGDSPEPYTYETYRAWESRLRARADEALELFHKWFWHLWT